MSIIKYLREEWEYCLTLYRNGYFGPSSHYDSEDISSWQPTPKLWRAVGFKPWRRRVWVNDGPGREYGFGAWRYALATDLLLHGIVHTS